MKLEGFDRNGQRIATATVVLRGRRAGQWRVEVDLDQVSAAAQREYVANYADAVRALESAGAARVEKVAGR